MLGLNYILLAALAASTTLATPVATPSPTPTPLKKFTLHGANSPQVPYAEGKPVLYAINGTDVNGYQGRLQFYVDQPGYTTATFKLAGPKNHLKIVTGGGGANNFVVFVDAAFDYPQYKKRADIDPSVNHFLECQDAYEGQPLRCRARGFPTSDQFRLNAHWKYSLPVALDQTGRPDDLFYPVDLIASAA